MSPGSRSDGRSNEGVATADALVVAQPFMGGCEPGCRSNPAGAVGAGVEHRAIHRRPDKRALSVGDVYAVVEPRPFRWAAKTRAVNAGV